MGLIRNTKPRNIARMGRYVPLFDVIFINSVFISAHFGDSFTDFRPIWPTFSMFSTEMLVFFLCGGRNGGGLGPFLTHFSLHSTTEFTSGLHTHGGLGAEPPMGGKGAKPPRLLRQTSLTLKKNSVAGVWGRSPQQGGFGGRSPLTRGFLGGVAP